MQLNKILYNSTYEVVDGLYSVAKIEKNFQCSEIYMVSFDNSEATAIYKQGTAQTGVIEAKNNYKLIAINVAVPFYSPGFIATISNSLAQNCIPVLVVSTYSKDYFIVQEKDYWGAIYELKKLGIKESKGE